jgi:hypothetical protein
MVEDLCHLANHSQLQVRWTRTDKDSWSASYRCGSEALYANMIADHKFAICGPSHHGTALYNFTEMPDVLSYTVLQEFAGAGTLQA